MKLHTQLKKSNKKRGAALVEYGLLVAGVALTTAVAVSMLGHKTNDLLGTVAGVLPSSDQADATPIESGRLFTTTQSANGGIILDLTTGPQTTEQVFGQGAGALIVDGQNGGN